MVLQTNEIVLIVLVVLVLFGATAIPKLARAMGRAQGEFNKAKKDFSAEAARAEAATQSQPATQAATPQGALGQPTEEQVRRTARDLGIDEAGKPLDEVKRLIAQRLA